MKFGLLLPPGVRSVADAPAAEASGFASVFIVDSPTIFGDPYVSMAAAAVGTTRLTLAIGVTNPRTRTAPVTASSIASLSALAPGRIALGLGVGFTANLAMGARNATVAELERYVRAVRELLRGEVAEVNFGSTDVPVQFLNHGLPFVNLSDRIPLYMAAMGPKSLALAKIYGPMVESTPGVDRKLVEDIARVRTAAYEHASSASLDTDPRRRHLVAYRGYLTQLQPWQHPLITPRVLRATNIFGTVEQCAKTVRSLDQHGIGHVILSPRPQDLASTIERFGRDIIPRFATEPV